MELIKETLSHLEKISAEAHEARVSVLDKIKQATSKAFAKAIAAAINAETARVEALVLAGQAGLPKEIILLIDARDHSLSDLIMGMVLLYARVPDSSEDENFPSRSEKAFKTAALVKPLVDELSKIEGERRAKKATIIYDLKAQIKEEANGLSDEAKAQAADLLRKFH